MSGAAHLSPAAAPAPRHGAAARFLASAWLTAALFAIAAVQQAVGHLDADVSWLITLAEQVLDGAAPYRDIMEPNPPAAFLSLAPAVLAGRWLAVRPEAMVVVWTLLLAGGALGLCATLGPREADPVRAGWMRNGATYLLTVAPAFMFAQREHFALIAMAPALARLSASGAPAPPWARALAGLGAAAALSFKPIFVLALLGPVAAVWLRARSERPPLALEIVVAMGAGLALAAALAWAFPDYLTRALPLVMDVYTASHEDTGVLLRHSLGPVYVALAALFLALARLAPPGAPSMVPFLASVGFFACFVLQRKGWMNHGYPAVALVLYAMLRLLVDRSTVWRGGLGRALALYAAIPAFVSAPAFFGVGVMLTDKEENPGLIAAVRSVAPPRPTIVVLGFRIPIGHPLTRRVDGVWAAPSASLWVYDMVETLLADPTLPPDRRARLEAYGRDDLARFAAALRRRPPDVVLVEGARAHALAATRPELAGALDNYRKAAVAGPIEVWTRAMDAPRAVGRSE